MKRLICLFAILWMMMVSVHSQKIDDAKLISAIAFSDSLIENNPRQFFRNVESLIVWSHDKVVFEKYYHGYPKDSLHHIQSQTKSIVALLMGIAIDKGFVKSEEEPVSLFFPEYFQTDDTVKTLVTIKDLLTMSAGFSWQEMIPFNDPANDNINMFNSGNYLNYAISRSMGNTPSARFNYNSGCPVIIAGIIEKATRMPLEKFAETYLFNPLGITQFFWIKDTTGFCHAGGGLYLKPIDVLKVGILVQNKGTYNNTRIVSEKWIDKMTYPYMATSFDHARYGYFWWFREETTGNGRTTQVISAEGAGGQNLYLFREYDLIIALTERNYTTPQVSPLFIREGILPCLE